ncbi:MAG TPA: hypothetical protein VHO84_14585 [Syntrophorhabdaceae bacterium]|nr:hypothetical protein [Syntrophorhabdaceae bacterium]
MPAVDTRTWLIIAAIVIAALIILVAWLSYKRNQSRKLQKRFGPEYGKSVHDLGSRTKAEAELKAREQRVEQLNLVPLDPSDVERFRETWEELQGHFVDSPKNTVSQADELVMELMSKRGYPMTDFERRAADISVNHPSVVTRYRAAQAIAVRNELGQADTEELREALVHYRALFNELLEVNGERHEVIEEEKLRMAQ